MSSERYWWLLVDDFITNFNAHRASTFYPGIELEADKSMVPWYGHGGNHISIGLPHYLAMDRKPGNSGEIQTLADVSSGILIYLKVVKSADKEKVIKKDLDLDPEEAAYGKGTRVLLDLMKTWLGSNRLVTEDAYFASTEVALALKERDINFIGNVKQCNSAFPKAYLDTLILSKRGDRHVLASISKDLARPSWSQ